MFRYAAVAKIITGMPEKTHASFGRLPTAYLEEKLRPYRPIALLTIWSRENELPSTGVVFCQPRGCHHLSYLERLDGTELVARPPNIVVLYSGGHYRCNRDCVNLRNYNDAYEFEYHLII